MAQITFSPPGVPLVIPPADTLVVRYDPTKSSNFFTLIPNVACLEIRQGIGADPGSARLRYVFDVLNPPAYPGRVEDVLGLDKAGPYVVRHDDRICVLIPFTTTTVNTHSITNALNYTVEFDGFAQVSQGDLSSDGEHATFGAVGVAARCWDSPLMGAVHRDGPDVTVVSDVQTDRPARFNPDGRPNRVPSGAFAGDGKDTFPTFVDPPTGETADANHAFWTVADAAKYILAQGNDLSLDDEEEESDEDEEDAKDEDAGDEGDDPDEGDDGEEGGDDPSGTAGPDSAYVTIPTLDALDRILCDYAAGFGLADPAKLMPVPIVCHDLDVTGDPWPVALAKLIHPYDFDFAFQTSQDKNGKPLTYLYFFRTDDGDGTTPKQLYFQAVPGDFDPALTNLGGMSIGRDASRLANHIVIDTQCTRHEVGIVLAPGFTVDPADGTGTAWAAFDSDNANYVPDNGDRYRVYVANEAGEGFWDFPSSSFLLDPTCLGLDDVFGAPRAPLFKGDQPVPQYSKRRRPGLATLFTLDGTAERHKARLYISPDYNQPIPGVWDRSGSLSEVKSEWELLPDRLGIRITTAKISGLNYGPPIPGFGTKTIGDAGSANTRLNLVISQTNTSPPRLFTSQNPRVFFLLVCVVESDRGLGAEALPRASSISKFGITRRHDERDRFVKHVVCASSPFNAAGKDSSDPRVTPGARDDTDDATTYAEALRATSENPTFEGVFTIPFISGAYEVGDRLSSVVGRGISLRTNGGAGQGEAPRYAQITGITRTFEPEQSTVIHAGDLRREATPPPEHQR